MMRHPFLLTALLTVPVTLALMTTSIGRAQQFERMEWSVSDMSNLYVNDGQSTALHYLQMLPETDAVRAVLVLLPSSGERTEDIVGQVTLPQLAAEKGILTIIPSINWGTEDRRAEIAFLDAIFRKLVREYAVPEDQFFLGGLSNGGIIALTYAEQSVREPGSTYVVPGGVFGLDVPLDKAHLYTYCQREIKRNFSEAGTNEARWILNNYNQTYGGSPEEFPERYVEASIYSYGAERGGNAQYLSQMPVRMYTDLDVEWLINERGRDLYDWNGTDIVAMINELKQMGNTDAQVHISMGKGVRPDGTRHPHSWSILDNRDCLEWILKLMGD